MQFLDREDYMASAQGMGGGHWKNAAARWGYHEAAIEVLRTAELSSPTEVLEMGTMGISILPGSDTIDYAEKWNPKGFRPTFAHDARDMPWPVADGAYKAFVALRVFHHLHPVQRECFLEARRIARNIVLVVPEAYNVPDLQQTSRGISEATFVEWNDGVPPRRVIPFAGWIGKLYFWDSRSLGW